MRERLPICRLLLPLVALAPLYACTAAPAGSGSPSLGGAGYLGPQPVAGQNVGASGVGAAGVSGVGTAGVGGAGTAGDGSSGAQAGSGTGGTPGSDAGWLEQSDGSVIDAAADGGIENVTGPLLGVYTGNDPNGITHFETWLGRPVDGILGYTGDASWSDYDGSVGWAIGNWSVLDRRVFWSVPLIPKGATLEAAANGDYDSHYRAAAKQLAKYRPGDAQVYIRTGWEFNGDWFPWAAKGKAAAFQGAFRKFVTAFRAESNRFVFEWNVNVGDVGMDPETAYPGDDYVDIIGMDFYWNTQWDPQDPNDAWNSMLTRKWGLQWHQDFAAAHGKKTAYSEWGVKSDAAGPYIQKAHDWFEQHDVVFHDYWDSNNAFTGKLSDGQYPNAGNAYRDAFGP